MKRKHPGRSAVLDAFSVIWVRQVNLAILIHDIFYEFDQILGAKKIQAILKQRGYPVTRKYVARIMQDLDLNCIRTDAKRTYVSLNRKPANIVQQQFQTNAPNQIWVSDVSIFY